MASRLYGKNVCGCYCLGRASGFHPSSWQLRPPATGQIHLDGPSFPKMQIPPAKLLDLLAPGETYCLRGAEYKGMDDALPYTEAVALTVRGHVEGIATPGGRLRYLRMLPESERPVIEHAEEDIDTGTSTVFANLNQGVYKQRTREVVVRETAHGHRYAADAGEVNGFVYAFCGSRL